MSKIFWKRPVYRVHIDITDKTVGDSVPSPISSAEFMQLSKNHEVVLYAKMGDVLIALPSYYMQDQDGLAQVVFLTNLPEIDGVHLSALILSDDEFSLIGA